MGLKTNTMTLLEMNLLFVRKCTEIALKTGLGCVLEF